MVEVAATDGDFGSLPIPIHVMLYTMSIQEVTPLKNQGA